MSTQPPRPTDDVATPVSPWYRMPMLLGALYCALVVAVTAAVLLVPLH